MPHRLMRTWQAARARAHGCACTQGNGFKVRVVLLSRYVSASRITFGRPQQNTLSVEHARSR
eukprot:4236335-Pleurochrysis_carterae.AAC.1